LTVFKAILAVLALKRPQKTPKKTHKIAKKRDKNTIKKMQKTAVFREKTQRHFSNHPKQTNICRPF
jgi:hypothetical protein